MSSGQARAVKKNGDFLRKRFNEQCCDLNGVILNQYLKGLQRPIAPGSFIMKTGKNWQFHLGQFDGYLTNWKYEISPNGKIVSYAVSETEIVQDLRSAKFLNRFLLKENYLVTSHNNKWIIFSKNDILKILQNESLLKWRILPSGRIKGDIYHHWQGMNWNKRAVFTLEYRNEEHKKSFVFGAHGGGAGERLQLFLQDKLLFNSVLIDYESWNE